MLLHVVRRFHASIHLTHSIVTLNTGKEEFKSDIKPYQRKQSSSGLHRPGAGIEDSLLLSSLSVSGAGQAETAPLWKNKIK